MFAIMVMTFLGFLLGFLAHIFLLLQIRIPTRELALVLNIGLVMLFLIRILLTKNVRQGNNWFWDRSIAHICPYKLKVWTIILFAYGTIMAVVSLIGMVSKMSVSMTEADYLIASRRLFIGVFSLVFACYVHEFTINYCFRIIQNKKGAIQGNDSNDMIF